MQRWGYLVTDGYRIETQADYDTWRGLRTYGGDTNVDREVAGDQFVDLLGNVLATPFRLTATSQSPTIRGDRSLDAAPEWRINGALQRCAFRVESGRLTLEYVTVVGWTSAYAIEENNGDETCGNGGGGSICLHYAAAMLVVVDSRFVDNVATDSSGPRCASCCEAAGASHSLGGAIYAHDSHMTIRITNTDFDSNDDVGGYVSGADAVYWNQHNTATIIIPNGGGTQAANANWGNAWGVMYGGSDCGTTRPDGTTCSTRYGRPLPGQRAGAGLLLGVSVHTEGRRGAVRPACFLSDNPLCNNIDIDMTRSFSSSLLPSRLAAVPRGSRPNPAGNQALAARTAPLTLSRPLAGASAQRYAQKHRSDARGGQAHCNP